MPHGFFDHAVPGAGVTLHDVVIVPGKLTAKKIHIAVHKDSGAVSGTATLESGNKTLHTTFDWQHRCDWKFTVEATHTDASTSTAVDMARVSGTITGESDSVGCHRRVHLTLNDYKIGDSTVDVALHATHEGFEGSATIHDLNLGGAKYPYVKLSVSTLSPSARIQGEMVANLGHFTVDSYVTSQAKGYEQSLSVTGADLKIEKGSIHFNDFHFAATYTIRTGECAEFKTDFGGSFTMKKTEYELMHARVGMTCGQLTMLRFKIRVSHTDATGATTEGVMAVGLDRKPGTTDGLGEHGVAVDAIHYNKGLFGSVELSKSRHFSKKYEGRTFSKDVTIGIIFGFGVYSTPSHPDSFRATVGAGGYFSADRVSGNVGCVYHHHATDFSCGGTLRLNPSWAGKYSYHWGDL